MKKRGPDGISDSPPMVEALDIDHLLNLARGLRPPSAAISHVSCPPEKTLRAWFASAREGRSSEMMEQHLIECASCRQSFVKYNLSVAPAITPPLAVGKAISVVVVGPDDLSFRLLQRMRRALEGAGAWVSSLDESDTLLAAIEVGSDSWEGPSISSQRLTAWVLHVEKIVEQHPGTGVYVTAGPGVLGHNGPIGPCLDEVEMARDRIRVGQVLLPEAAAMCLQREEIILQSRQDWALYAAFSRARRSLLRFASDLSDSLVGLMEGLEERLVELDFVSRAYRAQRFVPAELPDGVAMPYVQGDRIEVEFRSPPCAWLYLLRQNNSRLSLPFGNYPVRSPDEPETGRKELILDNIPGRERPLLIASLVPILALDELVAAVNQTPCNDRDEPLFLLKENFINHCGFTTFAIIADGTIDHGPATQRDVHPLLDQALRAIDADNYGLAERLLRDFLRLPDLGSDGRRARAHLGRVLRRQGQARSALEILLELVHDPQASGTADRAFACREIAWSLLELGRADETAEWINQALEGHRRTGERLEEARDFLARAWISFNQGHLKEAGEDYALSLLPAQQSGDGRLLAGAYQGLGQVLQELGMFQQAQEIYYKALSGYVLEQDLRGEMRSRGDIGTIALELKQYEVAVEQLEEQVALATRVGSPSLQGRSLHNLGHAYHARGLLLKARQTFEQSVVLCATFADRTIRLANFVALASLERREGHLDAALAWVEKIRAHLCRSNPQGTASPLELIQQAAIPGDLQWRMALTLGQCLDDNRDLTAELWFQAGVDVVEKQRHELPRLLRTDFLSISRALFDGWIAHLVARQAPAMELLKAVERARARAFLDSLIAKESREIQDAIESNKFLESIATSEVEIEDIQKNIGSGVGYIITYCLADRLMLFGLTREEVEMHVIDLSGHDLLDLRQQVLGWCKTAPRLGEGARAGMHALYVLSELLLSPLRDFLARLGSDIPLGVVLHGPLHEIPFHALLLPWDTQHDSPRYLLEQRAVFYAPSLSSIARWLRWPEPKTAGALVLANADGDLRHAEDEARQVLDCLQSGWLRTGKEASSAALWELAPHARFIHLAVHASRHDQENGAVLHLAGAPLRTNRVDVLPVPTLPLPVSWAHSERAIGASWVAALDLDAELVVASACESGRGQLTSAGEGTDLLSWAFLSAGARSVVATGWLVDDEASAQLMKRFYCLLVTGHGKSRALALAQRSFLTDTAESGPESETYFGVETAPDRRHPYFWAGYFLTGDWR